MAISTSFTAHFSEPAEGPAAALAQWRETRPAWLPKDYKEIEDSYNSVTWEWRHTQFLMKLTLIGSFFGGQTSYRITALFEEDGRVGSSVTVNGFADPKTRQAIKAAAEQYFDGGLV